MVLKKITYKIEDKNYLIEAKIVDTPLKKFFGLMFKKNSPPLLFTFNKEKNLYIHSLFCKPFKAIWLDENMNAIKITDVKNWKFYIPGKGKYLLEIPMLLKNSKSSTENKT
ncbi:MAG: hypothetical protein ABIF88_03210 [archaeon]